MQKVEKGNKVNVHYKGTLSDGTMFDSSEGRDPLEFTVGEGMVIQGFDNAVIDMQIGDKKSVDIPFMMAYGARNEQMIVRVPKTDVPEGMTPELGMQVSLTDNTGNMLPAEIVEITEDEIVLDGNHPLAGKDLTFEIELVSIS